MPFTIVCRDKMIETSIHVLSDQAYVMSFVVYKEEY